MLFAISIVIVMVVVAGLFLFTPSEVDPQLVVASEGPNEARFFDPIEYLKEGDGNVTDPLLFEGAEATSLEDIPRNAEDEPTELAVPVEPSPQPRSSRESAQRLRQALRDAQRPKKSATQRSVAAASPSTPAPSTEIARQPRKPQPIQKGATPAAATSAPVPRYWIQLFSSNRLESTQRAQLELEKYQVEGIISAVPINGENYYRLRVGPFHSPDEAEKFIVWFKQDQQFANSYVVHVAAR